MSPIWARLWKCLKEVIYWFYRIISIFYSHIYLSVVVFKILKTIFKISCINVFLFFFLGLCTQELSLSPSYNNWQNNMQSVYKNVAFLKKCFIKFNFVLKFRFSWSQNLDLFNDSILNTCSFCTLHEKKKKKVLFLFYSIHSYNMKQLNLLYSFMCFNVYKRCSYAL